MMQFSRFQNNGAWELSKVYAADSKWMKKLEGRAIERGMTTKQKNLVYIAGGIREMTYSKAFLMIANEDGKPISSWQHIVNGAKESMASSLENIFPPQAMPDHFDFTLEQIKYGSVIVAGNVIGNFRDKGPKEQFFVARLNAKPRGKLVWSFRYFDASSARTNLHVNKTCLGELPKERRVGEQIAGNRKVVAITGYQKSGEMRQLFVSCIDLINGTELWRQVVLPEVPAMTEGFDIVQDPETKNFLAVGYYYRSNGYKQLYVAVFDHKGSHLGSTRYELAGNIPGDIVAKDVICSIDKKSAVISGYINSAELNDNSKTFALELPFNPMTASPLWAKYYERSRPDPTATESIELSNDAEGEKTGYFITSQAYKPGIQPETYGIHIINTDRTGETLMSDPQCAVFPFKLNQGRGDKAMPLEKKQEKTSWNSFKVYHKEVTLIEQPCR
ncbi:MAG: hypothetical protein IPN33_06460 [Saprospiraceae bacterium]|nr:hypothetical protein [Saprospiraceae bacterium]